MNKKFINACKRVSQSVPPIWFMRQAGRYHSHYRDLKTKYTFEQLCKEPELAGEVALGPIQEFDYDVAILFSDILWPLEGLGLPLKFSPGPKFGHMITEKNVREHNDIDKAIDSVIDNSAFKNRDGLRAVAHLGGKTGMKKFVQSNGEYNPEDELGTSLLDYYMKFSN